MRIENSPGYEARMEAERQRREAEARRAEAEYQKAHQDWIAAGSTWMPMDACPFAAIDERYGFEGAILVTDGKARALAAVRRRLGKPIFYKTEPEWVSRDGVLIMIAGEADPRPDLPEWWWKWVLEDVIAGETYAYGEPAGKPEIDFVPTLWTFLPEMPTAPNAAMRCA